MKGARRWQTGRHAADGKRRLENRRERLQIFRKEEWSEHGTRQGAQRTTVEHVRWDKRTTVEHAVWYKHAGAKIACVQADDRRMNWCDGRPPRIAAVPAWPAVSRAHSGSHRLMRVCIYIYIYIYNHIDI
ncbi:hypothetical protein N9L68_00520 [bacterium]|nr:hypothetical protein [bacterium]